MRPARRLALRREVVTALDSDELRSVTAGQPPTLNLSCVVMFSDCVLTGGVWPTNGLVGCPLTLDPPRCAGR